MKTKSRIRHEILLATSNAALSASFIRESSAHDFIWDTVDSPRKMTLLAKKEFLPEIAILDLDSMNENLSVIIFYLNRLKDSMPILVISHKPDAALLDKVNKNLTVVLSLPLPTNKQSIKKLMGNVFDFLNEDLKKKMSKVEYLREENVFACTFENKEMFFVDRNDIPGDDKTAHVEGCEISADRYYFTIKYTNGDTADVPWDFVRHVADKEYEFYIGKEQTRNAALTAEEIGSRIIKARDQKNMTQEQLAAKTGILRNNISRIENGHHQPSLPILEKIAEGLGIPVVDLLAR